MKFFFFIIQVFKKNNISETIFEFMGDQIKFSIKINDGQNVKINWDKYIPKRIQTRIQRLTISR